MLSVHRPGWPGLVRLRMRGALGFCLLLHTFGGRFVSQDWSSLVLSHSPGRVVAVWSSRDTASEQKHNLHDG